MNQSAPVVWRSKRNHYFLSHVGPIFEHLLHRFVLFACLLPMNLGGKFWVAKLLKSEHERLILFFKPPFQGTDPEHGAHCALWRLLHVYSSPCWSQFVTSTAPFLYSPHISTELQGRSSSACIWWSWQQRESGQLDLSHHPLLPQRPFGLSFKGFFFTLYSRLKHFSPLLTLISLAL